MEEVLPLIAKAFAEALLNLVENVVEIRTDKGIDGAADACKDEAVFSTTNNSGIAVGEFKALAKLTICILQFGNQTAQVILDLTRSRVSGWIVAGIRNERVGLVAEKINFFDTVTMGAFEDNIVECATGKKGFEPPGKPVENTDFSKVVNGLHLLGDGTADGGAEHGLQIHVKAGLGRVEGFFERGFDYGKEGFHELGVVALFFDIFKSGERVVVFSDLGGDSCNPVSKGGGLGGGGSASGDSSPGIVSTDLFLIRGEVNGEGALVSIAGSGIGLVNEDFFSERAMAGAGIATRGAFSAEETTSRGVPGAGSWAIWGWRMGSATDGIVVAGISVVKAGWKKGGSDEVDSEAVEFPERSSAIPGRGGRRSSCSRAPVWGSVI